VGDFSVIDASGLAKNFEVQTRFVAEIVIDGGYVGPGAGTDIANRGGLKALVGKDLARGLDDFLPGKVVGIR